jgi:hypothetical protein
MQSEYAIYVVPDRPEVFNPCESISLGINWGGPHITISRFTTENGKLIPPVLNHIRKKFEKELSKNKNKPLWNPLQESVKCSPTKYIFESKTLKKISDFLRQHVENVKEDEFHLYNRLGVSRNLTNLGKTTWSLIMIKKTGQHVEWLTQTKVPIYNLN